VRFAPGGFERSDIKVEKKKGEADHAPSPPHKRRKRAYKDEILKRFGAKRQKCPPAVFSR